MKRIVHLGLVAAAATLAACSDTTNPITPVLTDAQVTADVAQQTADAFVKDIGEMLNSESFAGLPAPSFDLFGGQPITVNRTRTCYGGGVAQQQCNATTTDSVVIAVTMDGSFSVTNTTPHGTESMDATVHRTRNLTISGLAGTESTRIHNGVGTANDTTHFSGTADSVSRSRDLTLSASDSVQQLVFQLPHNTNPWPVSGKIIRNVSGKVVLEGPNGSGERTFTRRIEVTFPADGQGNVVLKVNAQTCTLNLTTRTVSNCS